MRYFVNTSAGQPIVAGGFTFDFELVGLRGGSWFGILAVEDDSAASALLDAGLTSVGEISFDRYDSEKKKAPQANPSLTSSHLPSQPPPPLPGMAVAERVGSLTPPPQVSDTSRVIESQTLESTDAAPPEEDLLKEVAKSKRRAQT